MEDILASIKRIIAEDSEAAGARAPKARKGPVAVPDPDPVPADDRETEDDAASLSHPAEPEAVTHEASDVLELTSPLVEPFEEPAMAAAEPVKPVAETPPVAPQPTILSGAAETASRNAFAALSQLQVRADAGKENTLEGLVADMLRPMLREWLDANLPAIVERTVEAEVKRVSGRA